jgi:uncharacterized protein YndB with AHSA1/START domain
VQSLLRYDIHLDQVFPASPAEVWRALTEPMLLAKWLMKNDFAANEGHRFRFCAKPTRGWDGIVHCQVLEAVPYNRLTYSWVGGSDMPNTMVTWILCPVNHGTKLAFSHTGFCGFKYYLIGRMLKRGWSSMITEGLPVVLSETAAG